MKSRERERFAVLYNTDFHISQRKFIDWKVTKFSRFRWNWVQEKKLRGIRCRLGRGRLVIVFKFEADNVALSIKEIYGTAILFVCKFVTNEEFIIPLLLLSEGGLWGGGPWFCFQPGWLYVLFLLCFLVPCWLLAVGCWCWLSVVSVGGAS